MKILITPLEREMLDLLARGESRETLMARLRIATSDLELQTRELFAVMGVQTADEAIVEARRRGILPLER